MGFELIKDENTMLDEIIIIDVNVIKQNAEKEGLIKHNINIIYETWQDQQPTLFWLPFYVL